MALVLVIAACGTSEPSADLTVPREPASVAAGKVLYGANCASCHGNELNGGRGPTLARAVALDDAEITDIIVRGRGLAMPAFGAQLTETEIVSVVDYIRSVQLERRAAG